MSTNLILCATGKTAKNPYRFRITNIGVYSYEEALYHCYHHFRQSVDDFLSDEFVEWVSDSLGLSFIASKIRELRGLNSFEKQFVSFLTITDYFDEQDIEVIRSEIISWEMRHEWEKLKERGDYLMNNDDPEKAALYYKKAFQYDANPAILNNLALSLIKTRQFKEAVLYLEKAVFLDNKSGGKDAKRLKFNYIEALVLSKEFEKARELLSRAEKQYGETGEVLYFYGEIEFLSGHPLSSIPYYERAIASHDDTDSVYRLADVYCKLRKFEKALETLNRIKIKDKRFLRKQAELYVFGNNIPAAIKCIEKALISDNANVDLWTRLAKYHRLDYDLNKASSAIMKARELSKDNPRANMEFARIRKAQGRIKEYQVILKDILRDFVKDYREGASI